jgi:cytochrome c oxidase assembly protein subunit 11
MSVRRENSKMVGKLAVITLGMFAFGYALIPIYKHICEMTGLNILSLSERQVPGGGTAGRDVKIPANSQVDFTRTITVEFDANARGPWDFKPAQRSVQVHPGQLTTVVYEFQNIQNRRMSAQAIPSYAPAQAASHFNKVECFCFQQYTLEPGEKKQWPVAFVIDPRLSKDVTTITLSYTFFEVGGKTPAAPQS